MNIRQLEIFIIVAQTENISQAAKHLFISQPAVSQTIQQLEQEIGLRLFDRPGRVLELNPAGKQFLQKAQHFLREYQDLERFAEYLNVKAPIKVGVNLTVANLWLAPMIKDFQATGQTLTVQADTAEAIVTALKAQELDLALLEGKISDPALICEKFKRYELVIVVAATHPLAAKKQLTVTEFLNEPLLLRDAGSAIRQALDRYLGVAQMQVRPLVTSINSQSLLELTAEKIGITFLPRALVEHPRNAGRFKLLRFEEKIYNDVQLVYQAAHELTPALKKFKKIVLQG